MSELGQYKVVGTHLGEKTRVVTADLVGAGQTGDDDHAERIDGSEVFQPLGFASRPVCGEHTEAIALRIGDQAFVLVIGDKSLALYTASPAPLEEGETRVSGAKEPSAVIRILPQGGIQVSAKSGESVVLNQGTLEVARRTDPVGRNAAMVAWMGAVESALSALSHPITAFPGSTTGTISAGASTVKA